MNQRENIMHSYPAAVIPCFIRRHLPLSVIILSWTYLSIIEWLL